MPKKFKVSEIMGSLDREVSEELHRTALRTAYALVQATPVGDPSLWKSKAPAAYQPGHARRNWHATIGAKSTQELPGFDTTGATAVQESAKVIAEWAKRGGMRSEALHIQNAVPYIERLNDGWSSQAPAGFVEKSVLAANGVNSHERRLLK